MKQVNLFNLFKKLLKKNNPVVIESGAHYGEDSMRFIKTFPSINLFCFEPDPRNIVVIKKYAKHERLHLYEYALSNRDGTTTFYQSHSEVTKKTLKKYHWIDPKEYVESKLSRSGASSFKKGIDNVSTIQVETIKLDTWMLGQEIDFIDLWWLDVQGAEKEVLLGAVDTLSKIKYIWVEYGAKMYDGAMTRKETRKLLKKRCFKVIEKYSSQNRNNGDLLFVNYGIK